MLVKGANIIEKPKLTVWLRDNLPCLLPLSGFFRSEQSIVTDIERKKHIEVARYLGSSYIACRVEPLPLQSSDQRIQLEV